MKTLAIKLAASLIALGAMSAAAQAACEPEKVAERYPGLAGKPVKVAVTPLYAPYSYTSQTEADKLIGSDIEISERALECVGLTWEYTKGVWTGLLPTVLNGQTDVMVANLYYNAERAEKVDFVVYMKAGNALLVRKGNAGKYKSMDDLCGFSTNAVVGSASQKTLEEQSAKCVADGKEAITITAATETDAAVRGLMNDRIDFLLDNDGAATVRVADAPETFEIAFVVAREVKVGNATLNDNEELLQAYHDGMKEISENGTMAEIFTKYKLDPKLMIPVEIVR